MYLLANIAIIVTQFGHERLKTSSDTVFFDLYKKYYSLFFYILIQVRIIRSLFYEIALSSKYTGSKRYMI